MHCQLIWQPRAPGTLAAILNLLVEKLLTTVGYRRTIVHSYNMKTSKDQHPEQAEITGLDLVNHSLELIRNSKELIDDLQKKLQHCRAILESTSLKELKMR